MKKDYNYNSLIDKIIIQHYEYIIKIQNKKAIDYIEEQEQLLKNSKNIEQFFENFGQSKSTIYFFKNLPLQVFEETLYNKKNPSCYQIILEITLNFLWQSVKDIQTCFLDKWDKKIETKVVVFYFYSLASIFYLRENLSFELRIYFWVAHFLLSLLWVESFLLNRESYFEIWIF